MPTELIVKSFEACGITVATDGTEDNRIHCMKDGNPAAGGKEILKKRTAALLREDEEDPFKVSESEDSCSEDELSFPSSDEGELYRQEQDISEEPIVL